MKRIFLIMTIGLVCCNLQLCIAQTWQQVFDVKTPNCSTVQDTYILTSADVSLTSGELSAYKAYLSAFNAQLIESPSYKYNCHGYAWHVYEGGNKVFIGLNLFYSKDAADIYCDDNSYVACAESEATKVFYHRDGDHSAVKLDNTWYQSKIKTIYSHK